MREEQYENELRACAETVCGDSALRWVMIAGGSCSGKTTTTKKLARLIRENGRPVEMISLDDYYRNPENAVYLSDGKQDVEGLQSLRLDLLRETMKLLTEGRPAPVPFFDFQVRRRMDHYRVIKPQENGVIMVEGLHALNPAICVPEQTPDTLFRIYLYVESDDGMDSRFLRRLVRDSRYRASDAAETCARWDTVRAAEKETIEPFASLADRSVNTYFDYERRILADDAVAVLKGLSEEDPHYECAQRLIARLKTVPLLPDEAVPPDSLLREFI